MFPHKLFIAKVVDQFLPPWAILYSQPNALPFLFPFASRIPYSPNLLLPYGHPFWFPSMFFST